MHKSSWQRLQWFITTYLQKTSDRKLDVLDVGALHINGSYRQFFDPERVAYSGLDIVEGRNIDIVLERPYDWSAIADNSYDVVVSGQTFTHIEFFWITFAHMARVLRPGGYICVTTPFFQPEQKHPVDCWRFTKHGMLALCRSAGLEPLHISFDEKPAGAPGSWFSPHGDCMLVARKPDHGDLRPVDPDVSPAAFTTLPETPGVQANPTGGFKPVSIKDHRGGDRRLTWFMETYVRPVAQHPAAVLELTLHTTHQHAFSGKDFAYRSISLGPDDPEPYRHMKALGNDTQDLIVSIHALQSTPYIWTVIDQAARALKPGGLLFLVAPFTILPLKGATDFYRFNTDGLIALAKYAGLDVVHASRDAAPENAPADWFSDRIDDTMLVARKPAAWAGSIDPDTYVFKPANYTALRQPLVKRGGAGFAERGMADFGSVNEKHLAFLKPLVDRYGVQTYLDLSQGGGSPVYHLAVPKKTWVSPHLPQAALFLKAGSNVTPKRMKLSAYFESAAARGTTPLRKIYRLFRPRTFDLIFSPGPKTFQESYKAFDLCRKHMHDNSLYVMSGTVPSDPYSTLPDRAFSLQVRARSGFQGRTWYGDAYKTVFAIHALHRDYSYCTIIDGAESYTVVWRTAGKRRLHRDLSLSGLKNAVVGRFRWRSPSTLKDLEKLDYFQMLALAPIMMVVPKDTMIPIIGMELDPVAYGSSTTWRQLVSPTMKMKP